MSTISDYELILNKLSWYQISSMKYSINNGDSGNKIILDFNTNKKGEVSCNDNDGQPLPVDIIEEFSEVVLFRKKQEEIDKGIPQEQWEIRS
jgi:hypothetical protein